MNMNIEINHHNFNMNCNDMSDHYFIKKFSTLEISSLQADENNMNK